MIKVIKELNIPKATTSRFLSSLESEGILEVKGEFKEIKTKTGRKTFKAINVYYINTSVKQEIDKIIKNLQEDL